MQPARRRVPVRRAEPGERRHEIDAAGVVDRRGEVAARRWRSSRAPRIWPNQSTAPPVTVMLPSSAYCSLSGKAQATVVDSPWRERTGAGDDRHQRRAGAVRRLHLAGREGRVAEERRMRIANRAGDRHALRARESRVTVDRRCRSTARTVGQDGGAECENSDSSSGIPRRRVADRRAACATRWWRRRHERRHRSGSRSASCRSFPRRARRARRARIAIGNRVEQPAHLAGGEQRIDRQTGAALEMRLQAATRAASRRSRAVRRHCQTMTGPTGRPVSRSHTQHGFALIGDGDGVDGCSAGADDRHSSIAVLDAAPDARRRPARPSQAAGTRSATGRVARATTSAALVEQQDLRVRRALVDREDVSTAMRLSACTSAAGGGANALRRRGRSARAGTPAEPVGANTPGTPSSRIRTGCVVDDHLRDRAAESAVAPCAPRP